MVDASRSGVWGPSTSRGRGALGRGCARGARRRPFCKAQVAGAVHGRALLKPGPLTPVLKWPRPWPPASPPQPSVGRALCWRWGRWGAHVRGWAAKGGLAGTLFRGLALRKMGTAKKVSLSVTPTAPLGAAEWGRGAWTAGEARPSLGYEIIVIRWGPFSQRRAQWSARTGGLLRVPWALSSLQPLHASFPRGPPMLGDQQPRGRGRQEAGRLASVQAPSALL